jgi:hypothetical protein
MCDAGESQQQLLEQFEGSLVGPSIRPVPFTNPDGREGVDLYLAREAFRDAFAADVGPETAAVMAAAQRPYAAAAFAATLSVSSGTGPTVLVCFGPRGLPGSGRCRGGWGSDRAGRGCRGRRVCLASGIGRCRARRGG